MCGLKILLSDFLKASISEIDLIWFSRAFHRIIDLYEHDFLIISVLGLGNLKVIFLLRLNRTIKDSLSSAWCKFEHRT